MKNWQLCALLAVSVPSIAAAQDAIDIVTGGVTSPLVVGDSLSSFTAADGWVVSATATSSSPGLSPFGINLQVTASCSSGACLSSTNPLDVFFTSAHFTSVPANATFGTNFATSETTGETSRAITWAASDNGTPPTPFLGGLPGNGTDHIGTVTLGASGFGSAIGNPSAGLTSPYDLTIEEAFTDSTGTAASFAASGNVTAAPEIDPASMMGALTLLAGGLAVLRGRRREK